jgi:hypothetical protein
MSGGAPDGTVARRIQPEVPPDWPAHGLGPVRPIAVQLPEPAELQAGDWVALSSGEAAVRQGLMARLLSRPASPRVHLAVRCTALLTRGYVDVRADEHGTAYGRVRR